MKTKINHGIRKKKYENWKTQEDMTPGSLLLKIGQEFRTFEHDPGTHQARRKHVKIIKLYRHHALCRVNGRHLESYTYNELYTMGVGGSSARYRDDLPRACEMAEAGI